MSVSLKFLQFLPFPTWHVICHSLEINEDKTYCLYKHVPPVSSQSDVPASPIFSSIFLQMFPSVPLATLHITAEYPTPEPALHFHTASALLLSLLPPETTPLSALPEILHSLHPDEQGNPCMLPRLPRLPLSFSKKYTSNNQQVIDAHIFDSLCLLSIPYIL